VSRTTRFSTSTTWTHLTTSIDYRIEARGWHAFGYYSGPPDACFPDEGELEIVRCIRLDDDGNDAGEVDFDATFTDEQEQRDIEWKLWDRARWDDYDDGPDPDMGMDR